VPALLLAGLLLAGCSESEHELIVEVRSDLSPGIEFVAARARLVDPRREETAVATVGTPFAEGVRLAEWAALPSGSYELEVDAIDVNGDVVVARTVRIDLAEDLAVTVVLSRSCADVVCPSDGDMPNQTTCASGRCVDPSCSDVATASCGAPQCDSDDACIPPSPCAVASCVEGGCFFPPDDSLCMPGQTCLPESGCTTDERVVIGSTYVGDDGGSRFMATPYRPVAVMIQAYADSVQPPVFRTATMADGESKPMGEESPMVANAILSFADDGFVIGDSPLVNESGASYAWTIFADHPGVYIGSYVGNGTAQSITGVGFEPAWVIFGSDTDGAAVVSYGAASEETFRFTEGPGAPGGVTSFTTDGFNVGDRPFTNQDGVTIHYIAFGESPGISAGTYMGDGGPGRDITGVGFRPMLVMIRSDGTDGGHYRGTWGAPATSPFFTGAPVPDGIVAFAEDSFSLGSYAPLNTAGTPYHYLAFITVR